MIIDTKDLVKERSVFLFLVYAHPLNTLNLSEFHLDDDDKPNDAYPEDDQILIYDEPFIGSSWEDFDGGDLGPEICSAGQKQ